MRRQFSAWLVVGLVVLGPACGDRDAETPAPPGTEPTTEADTQPPPDTVPPPEPPPAPKSVIVVFDASGSMGGEREGRRKIDIAREAFGELIDALPDEALRAGLVAYGHRRKEDCGDIELLVPLEPLDSNRLAERIRQIAPRGMTPIAAALELAGEQLATVEDERAIVLFTDGENNCPGDPSAVVRKLRDKHGIRVHVIGFDIMKAEAAIELRALAEAGRGGYFTAATVEGLNEMSALVASAVETGEVRLDQTVQENIHIVLDRSLEMQDEYLDGDRKTTRLGLAKGALGSILDDLAADRDNMAYRHFGGSCAGGGSELIVPFGLNRGPEIRARLEYLEARGEDRTLVDAVIEAARDFSRADVPEGVSKRVVIITGGTGSCFQREATARIRQVLANREIRPKYHFIGIGLYDSQIRELQEIVSELGGTLSAVLTQEQMEEELGRIFETLPAIDSLEQVIQVVNDGVELLNKALEGIKVDDHSGASARAQSAADLSATLLPFRDLARRRTQSEFQEFFEIARKLREIQREMAPVVLAMIEEDQQGEIEEYNRQTQRQIDLSIRYNELVDQGLALLRAMARG